MSLSFPPAAVVLFLAAVLSLLEIGPMENFPEVGTRKATRNPTVLLTNTIHMLNSYSTGDRIGNSLPFHWRYT